jgi:hypothetical protein
MQEQSVYEGAIGHTCPRVHDNTRRFIDHQDIRILMHDPKGHGLGAAPILSRLANRFQCETLSAAQTRRGTHCDTIASEFTGFDPARESCPRETGKQRDRRLVHPTPSELPGHHAALHDRGFVIVC